MVLIFGLFAVVWWGGAAVNVPKSARWGVIFLIYIAVLGIQFVFPIAHPLRVISGGGSVFWLSVGVTFGVIWAYRAGLNWLRDRAAPATETAQVGPFSDAELTRYARHIVLREVGGMGQTKLKDARVLVIGAGGLGSPALMYLAAAGVGTIGVVDDDDVDSSNLQRQVIHFDKDIGEPKVHSAAEKMREINPFVTVKPYRRRLDETSATALFADYDLVLDGTDNFATRYLINQTCVAQGIPLISGALTQWEGQLSVFDPKRKTPCYQCIFPEAPAADLAPNCAEAGVMGPLPGIIGSMMALEAVKLISGAGQPLLGEMLIFDGLYGETRKIGLKPRADCPICGGK